MCIRLLMLCLAAGAVFGQAKNPEALVNEWIKRLNALTDAQPRSVDRLAELYDEKVLQFTGPNENQIGPVTYAGLEGVRKWAENFAREYSKSEFRIQVETEHVKTTGLLLTATPPWGGTAVAFEATAFYTMRENKKSFAAPSAVFLEFTDEGKIRRARIYLEKDETIEITP